MPLLRYRYCQPADGRHHYPGPSPQHAPRFRVVYEGAIAAYDDETIHDVLARLIARHSMPTRPEGGHFRPAGTGDLLDLGERGLWQVLPVSFRALAPEGLRLESAA